MQLSAQDEATEPANSSDVLLGESSRSAASAVLSPATCSNELLELLNGLHVHTVEVGD